MSVALMNNIFALAQHIRIGMLATKSSATSGQVVKVLT